MKVTRLIIGLLLLLAGINANAQNDKLKGFSITPRFHGGFLAAHYGSMRYLVQQHAWAAEIVVSKQTDGRKAWQRSHNYPTIDYAFMHMNPGSPDYIGNIEALLVRLNYSNHKKRLVKSHVTMGAGLGFVQKPWHRTENHKNIALGSYINLMVNFQYLLQWEIHPNFKLETGIEIIHFSNTAMTSPNLGINLPMLSLGAKYKIPYKDEELNRDSLPPLKKRNIYTLAGAFGVKENITPGGKKYFAYSFWGDYVYKINHKWAAGGGFDFFYNNTIRGIKESNGEPTAFFDVARGGAHVSLELFLNRLSIFQHVGFYTHNTLKRDGAIYNRSGIRYTFNGHIFTYVSMKAHRSKADYSEFGLGYIF